MNFGVLGYGRMGREVEKAARQHGHQITAIFDEQNPLSRNSDLNGSDVLISFCLKDVVLGNLEIAARKDIPVVEGTTGWYDQLGNIKQIPKLTLIYSPNFSIGMYQYSKLVEYAARLYAPFGDYDCYLHEWHHTGKADSPSGTARKLAAILLAKLPQKKYVLESPPDGKIDPAALHVTSTRVGSVAGTHEIGFNSPFDTILLRHTAHGREGFAQGAVMAAEWIVGRKGIFTMEDFMNSITADLLVI